MLKLLFIDDQQDAIQPAINAVAQTGLYTHAVCTFQDSADALRYMEPDIVVLDLMDGIDGAGQQEAWQAPYDLIWSQRFCPIVVFSAFADQVAGAGPDTTHPFVASVVKGNTGPADLVAALALLRGHADVLSQTEAETRQRLRAAMKDVAPLVFASLPNDADARVQATQRLSKRRLAALLDEKLDGVDPLAWEQYLCPPLPVEGLLTGDLLQRTGSDAADPASFVIVLSPSCDLVGSAQQPVKVDSVLVAQCVPFREAAEEIHGGTLPETASKKLKDKVTDELSAGYYRQFLFLPELQGAIPEMAANLKKLLTIPVADVIGTAAVFSRVASVDSPFRELVTWAYLQSVGRPGLPNRDRELWYTGIVSRLYPAGQNDNAGN
jgi:hypothetical protein